MRHLVCVGRAQAFPNMPEKKLRIWTPGAERNEYDENVRYLRLVSTSLGAIDVAIVDNFGRLWPDSRILRFFNGQVRVHSGVSTDHEGFLCLDASNSVEVELP